MKSVVLEIKENKAAVLDDKGIVHAVKNRDYKVGQVLELTEFELGRDEIKGRGSGHLSAFSRTAAAVLAVAVIGGGATAYAAPVSTVTLNGAETVEYKLNVFDRVIGVSAAENDDEEFRKGLSELEHDVRGMKIGDAIDVTTERFEDDLFMPDDTGKEPQLTVRVGGLKKRNRAFSERLDHKVEEIQNRRPGDEKPQDITEDMQEGKPEENMAEKDTETGGGETKMDGAGQYMERPEGDKAPEKIPAQEKGAPGEDKKPEASDISKEQTGTQEIPPAGNTMPENGAEQSAQQSPGNDGEEQSVQQSPGPEGAEQSVQQSPGNEGAEQSVQQSPGPEGAEQSVQQSAGPEGAEQSVQPSPEPEGAEQPVQPSPEPEGAGAPDNGGGAPENEGHGAPHNGGGGE